MKAERDQVQDASATQAIGRPWRCSSGDHVLGFVRRENNARQLYLLDGHVITGSAQVWCASCESHREWHAGADALEHLMQRRNRAV